MTNPLVSSERRAWQESADPMSHISRSLREHCETVLTRRSDKGKTPLMNERKKFFESVFPTDTCSAGGADAKHVSSENNYPENLLSVICRYIAITYVL